MHPMTKENLKSGFSGESQAHMKYLVFAERVHASNHLAALNGGNLTLANLDVAIEGETFEVGEMYPAYKAVAELQDEKKAVRSMHYALEAEKIHATMYQEAKDAARSGRDFDIGEIHICPVCGHTAAGNAPERCPVCGVQGSRYRKF